MSRRLVLSSLFPEKMFQNRPATLHTSKGTLISHDSGHLGPSQCCLWSVSLFICSGGWALIFWYVISPFPPSLWYFSLYTLTCSFLDKFGRFHPLPSTFIYPRPVQGRCCKPWGKHEALRATKDRISPVWYQNKAVSCVFKTPEWWPLAWVNFLWRKGLTKSHVFCFILFNMQFQPCTSAFSA